MLAAFAVLAGVIGRQALEHRAEDAGHAKMQLQHNVQLIAARQQSIIAHADALLHELAAHSPELRPGAPAGECARMLADRLGHTKGVIQIGKALPDGELACAAVPPKDHVSFADRNWFREALKSDRMVIGDVVTGRIQGKPTINIARTERDDVGRVSAVLYLSLDLEWLRRELARAELPEGARLVVADACLKLFREKGFGWLA